MPDMPQGKKLRLLLPAPRCAWSFDGWRTTQDMNTHDPLGCMSRICPTALECGAEIVLFLLQSEQRWEGTDFNVKVEDK